jgi:hypothetical protein
MKGNTAEGITLEMVKSLLHKEKDDPLDPVSLACRGYCEYYRGDQGEEGCRGLAVVRRGVATGKIGLTQLTFLLDAAPGTARRSGCLINEMCSKCSYLKGDCDFMSASPPPDATPCGGYRLLQALLDHGALTPAIVRGLVTGRP